MFPIARTEERSMSVTVILIVLPEKRLTILSFSGEQSRERSDRGDRPLQRLVGRRPHTREPRSCTFPLVYTPPSDLEVRSGTRILNDSELSGDSETSARDGF